MGGWILSARRAGGNSLQPAVAISCGSIIPWPLAVGHGGGSEIGVYDVNGDGLNDVVTSLQAHGWGLAWFEQKRAKDGEITFVNHGDG